jgi:hypothetical protein
MDTFSLLQVSLDQMIDRGALEDASDAARSIARADCTVIHRNLFGIVVSGLERNEALAFQAALQQRNFPTDLVADRELPVLHEPYTIQRIEIGKNSLSFTDSMGREHPRTIEDLVFLAGGFLTQNKMKSALVVGTGDTPYEYSSAQQPRLERQQHIEEVPEFRLDFFFWSSPNRFRTSVSAESTMFFHGRPLRLRDTALLLGAMMDLRELLPPERVGAGLKRSDTQTAYPSLKRYEEEIRWHFHRLKARA